MLSLDLDHWIPAAATVAIVWCISRIARKDRKAIKVLLGLLLIIGAFELFAHTDPSGIATGSRSLSLWALTRMGIGQPFIVPWSR
jgi:hypothetical protein